MSWPPATREAHEKFCQAEGWARVRDARGRSGTHHVTYELTLPDGAVLRTRISHPVDRSDYGPRLWSHILRDQLEVSQEEFWACVREGKPPQRSAQPASAEALPADLVHLLLNRVGLAPHQVAVMSKQEAIGRLQQYWTEGS